ARRQPGALGAPSRVRLPYRCRPPPQGARGRRAGRLGPNAARWLGTNVTIGVKSMAADGIPKRPELNQNGPLGAAGPPEAQAAPAGLPAAPEGISEAATATLAPVVDDKAQATEAPRYGSYHDWLEHNPLDPELANLVSCPEDLTPALTAQKAGLERQ